MPRLHISYGRDGAIHLFREADVFIPEPRSVCGTPWDGSLSQPLDAALLPLCCRACCRWYAEGEALARIMAGLEALER